MVENLETLLDNVESRLEKQGIKKIDKPTLEQARDAFRRTDERELNERWESYINLQLALCTLEMYTPPNLDIIGSADIRVYHSNRIPCNCDHDFTIERLSAPFSLTDAGNFAGYDAETHCYAFRGQRRLFREFLSLVEPLFKKKAFKSAIVRSVGVRVPMANFATGWDFDEFASHVEAMECMLFLKKPLKDPLKFKEAAAYHSLARKDAADCVALELFGEEAVSRNDATNSIVEGKTDTPHTNLEPRRYSLRRRKLSSHH